MICKTRWIDENNTCLGIFIRESQSISQGEIDIIAPFYRLRNWLVHLAQPGVKPEGSPIPSLLHILTTNPHFPKHVPFRLMLMSSHPVRLGEGLSATDTLSCTKAELFAKLSLRKSRMPDTPLYFKQRNVKDQKQ